MHGRRYDFRGCLPNNPLSRKCRNQRWGLKTQPRHFSQWFHIWEASVGEQMMKLPTRLDGIPGNKVRPQIAEAIGPARIIRSQPA